MDKADEILGELFDSGMRVGKIQAYSEVIERLRAMCDDIEKTLNQDKGETPWSPVQDVPAT